jgi:hypothetical protein
MTHRKNRQQTVKMPRSRVKMNHSTLKKGFDQNDFVGFAKKN